MAIQINGNGTITGISAGGLPAGSVTSATLADGAASGTKLIMPAGTIIQTKFYRTTTQTTVNTSVFFTCNTCNILPPTIVDLAGVTALAAIMSVSTIPSGKPPTEIPVIVPLPFICIAILNYCICTTRRYC